MQLHYVISKRREISLDVAFQCVAHLLPFSSYSFKYWTHKQNQAFFFFF